MSRHCDFLDSHVWEWLVQQGEKTMDRPLILLCFLFGSYAALSTAYAECDHSKLKLQDYEPNTAVVRNDQHDKNHLDFVLSQMYPLFHDGCEGSTSKQAHWLLRPYFSFTGQFGFYAFNNRSSNPVIGKRYNPKLFVRHWINDNGEYFDIGYAHESNGQSIDTQSSYLQKQAEIDALGDSSEFANDYLSRGWDYIDINYKFNMPIVGFHRLSYYLNLKFFLNNTYLQGEAEEFYPWETNNGKERSEVDGISFMIKSSDITDQKSYGVKLALLHTTGYKNAFRYHTGKMEITYKMKNWPPFLLWVANGYNSNLTDYYRDVFGVGFGIELRNFLKDY